MEKENHLSFTMYHMLFLVEFTTACEVSFIFLLQRWKTKAPKG